MDSEIAARYYGDLEALRTQARDLISRTIHSPNWEALDYATNGVSELHQEFRKVAGWGDFLSAQLQELMLRRNEIVFGIRDEAALLERVVEKELVDKAQSWAARGLASSERVLMARQKIGDRWGYIQRLEVAIEALDAQLDVLRLRIKRQDDFKYDARLLKDMLNFGHILQEL
jgi:hypothetical protein